MKRLLRPAFLALLAPLAVAALGACSNDSNFTQDATTTNVAVSASVYALSGSSPELQAAYQASTNAFVRPVVGGTTGLVNFDIAFDINSEGKVILLPVRTLVPFAPAPVTADGRGAPSIGLLKSVTTFDLIEKAPTKGYILDSTMVASAGETILIKLVTSGCVYSEPLYGKLVIDSVIVSQKRIVARALTNRNCGGYRSLTAGLPKD